MRRETLHLTLCLRWRRDRDRLPALEGGRRRSWRARVRAPDRRCRLLAAQSNRLGGLHGLSGGCGTVGRRPGLALASAGFEIEKRRFVPHVTLVRKAAMTAARFRHGVAPLAMHRVRVARLGSRRKRFELSPAGIVAACRGCIVARNDAGAQGACDVAGAHTASLSLRRCQRKMQLDRWATSAGSEVLVVLSETVAYQL